jgi:hypothetical protein
VTFEPDAAIVARLTQQSRWFGMRTATFGSRY